MVRNVVQEYNLNLLKNFVLICKCNCPCVLVKNECAAAVGREILDMQLGQVS